MDYPLSLNVRKLGEGCCTAGPTATAPPDDRRVTTGLGSCLRPAGRRRLQTSRSHYPGSGLQRRYPPFPVIVTTGSAQSGTKNTLDPNSWVSGVSSGDGHCAELPGPGEAVVATTSPAEPGAGGGRPGQAVRFQAVTLKMAFQPWSVSSFW